MIHMLIGIQGSGKTTFAKELRKMLNCNVASTDYIRMTVEGIKEEEVWPRVYQMCKDAIIAKEDIIYDATNITPKVRKRLFDQMKETGVNFEIGAYYFIVDPKVCVERVKKRNNQEGELYLPPEVVFSYASKIIEPTFEEGFAFIKKVKDGKVIEENYYEK